MLDRLRAFFASEREFGNALSCFDLDASALRSAMAKAHQFVERWTSLPPIAVRELVRTVVETVVVQDDKITASLKQTAVATVLLGDSCNVPGDRQLDAIELSIEAKLRRAGKGIRLIVGGGAVKKPDGHMIALLRAAHATREALMTGRDETIEGMAHRFGVKRSELSAHLRLTYLAPDIIRALIEGRHPDELSPARVLAACRDLPHDWQLQRAALGFETR